MDPAKDFLGKIDRRKTPEVCARCHSDAAMMRKFQPQQRVNQLALYRTSVHGQRLTSGDTQAATCLDCHGVHDIREVKDVLSPVHPLKVPSTCARCHADSGHMERYEIRTDQFDLYLRSAHWEALADRGILSAPNCATCHGNHAAAPPGAFSVEHVCGSCHVVFQDLFDQSPHKPAFEAMGFAACVVCHKSHEVLHPSPEMLGVGSEAVCVRCHSQGEPGYTTAAAMKTEIDRLRTALDEAEQILNRAESAGMEVSEGRLKLASAHEDLIKARLHVHTFRVDAVSAPVERGLTVTREGFQIGEDALRDRDVRRLGLGTSLTIFIAIAGLWLAVRRSERRGEPTPTG